MGRSSKGAGMVPGRQRPGSHDPEGVQTVMISFSLLSIMESILPMY